MVFRNASDVKIIFYFLFAYNHKYEASIDAWYALT